ncbi:MAG TPA: type II toxin-antitoxin system VapB family antitoxin [Xanthobacteraceae bacterium]|jgi:antitoxin VapB|nr:type II toxin-antitoxin system VapB family antitoxin [Xanthobacteraceae bacterium]
MGRPQLNIKDAEATRLARELAELTGESQTEAVRKALAERLDREKAERDANTVRTAEESRREFERVWPKIQKIQEEIRKIGFADKTITDHDLYDENGLPK